MTDLRLYQQEDQLKVKDLYYQGRRRLLGVQATGLGKTKLFSSIYNVIPRTGKMLVIVNREELIEQSVDALQLANPTLMIGVEQAQNRHCAMDDIVVASIQTIGGVKEDEDGNPEFNNRILSLDPDEFSIIICDEAHRALAKSWIQAMKYFKVYKSDERFNDPEKLLLCLTATPNRADNKGLEEICDDIAFVRDIRWGIENGWLCDIEAYRINTRVDISDVKVTRGDFDNRQLANRINTEQRNQLVVENYLKIASGLKGLFFTMDIAHAKDLAEALNKAGVKAAAVYSGMSKQQRRETFAAHKSGELTALCGANIFLEGYDDPTIMFVGMVRPTKSNVLYTQAIGRGLRPFPSPEAVKAIRDTGKEPESIKSTVIVADFVDVSSRHSLITVPTLFGLNGNVDLKGKKALQSVQELEEEISKIPGNKKSLVKLDEIEDIGNLSSYIEKIDLLKPPETPAEIKSASELSWVKSETGYTLGTPENTYSIAENTLGNYSIYSNTKGLQQYVGSANDLESAIKLAEGKLDDNQYQFSKRSASWKQAPVTIAQANLLSKLDKSGVKMFKSKEDYISHVMSSFTKFQVSAMITEKMATRGRR